MPWSSRARIATQRLSLREVESRKYGTSAESATGLFSALQAMADVESQGLRKGSSELDGATLAACFHVYWVYV